MRFSLVVPYTVSVQEELWLMGLFGEVEDHWRKLGIRARHGSLEPSPLLFTLRFLDVCAMRPPSPKLPPPPSLPPLPSAISSQP